MGHRPDHSERVVTPGLALFFLAAAAVLVPWTVILFLTLPHREDAARWHIAWGGFDTLLILVFASAGIRILRLSPTGALVMASASALLVTDAWFDIMTAPTTGDLIRALVMAGLVELPMAAVCVRAAWRIIGLFNQAKPYLRSAGFTVHHGRLVPPPDWQDRIALGREGQDAQPPPGS
jgi:hypothetical protein